LEGLEAVRRAEAGRAVVARARLALVRAGRRLGEVLARGDVEEVPRVAVRIRAVDDARLVAGQAVDARDDRRGDARPPDDVPAAPDQIRVVDRDAGVRVGHRGDVGDAAHRAAGVLLPARLEFP